MKRLLFSVLLALGLAGCAASPDLPQNYALDVSRSEGLAVFSLTLAGKPLNKVTSFEYLIREIPPQDEEGIATKLHFSSTKQHAKWAASGATSRDVTWKAVVKGPESSESLNIFEDKTAIGRLIAMRLPEGEYEFHAWRLMEPNPYGEMEYSPKQSFSYRFHIKSGKATYLGRLKLWLSERDTQRLTVENQEQYDIELLGTRHPGFNGFHISREVGRLQYTK